MQEQLPSNHSMIIEGKAQENNLGRQSLSVQRAVILEEALKKAEEAERKRIADYLHDGIAQYLSLASMRLSKLNSGLPNQNISQDLQEVNELLHRSIRETRGLIHELHESTVKEKGLGPALMRKKIEWVENVELDVVIKLMFDESAVSIDRKILVYRIINELVRNVTKHAKASRLSILIKQKETIFEVSVADNGHGFSRKPGFSPFSDSGYGIMRIREVVESAEGKIDIETKYGAGSRIRITLPKQK